MNWSTWVGHVILSGIFRFDVDRIVRAGVKGITDAQYAWGRLAFVNTERAIGWFAIGVLTWLTLD